MQRTESDLTNVKSTRKLRESSVAPYEYFFSHLLGCSERYYKGILEDSRLGVKLTGNWETLVGDQDTYIHILEYENYGGYDKAIQLVRTSEV